jgi:hypothetical protein
MRFRLSTDIELHSLKFRIKVVSTLLSYRTFSLGAMWRHMLLHIVPRKGTLKNI